MKHNLCKYKDCIYIGTEKCKVICGLKHPCYTPFLKKVDDTLNFIAKEERPENENFEKMFQATLSLFWPTIVLCILIYIVCKMWKYTSLTQLF